MTTMRDTFQATVSELLDTDPRVALVLADIGSSNFRRAAARHPDRVLNVGIREQLMVGVAAGLSLIGFRPIVHSYTPFLVERPFEMLKLDLGHNDAGAVLVSIGASHDTSSEGRTHQAPEDVALLATLPGWEVYIPGHPDEADALLRHAAGGDGRAYVRLSAQSNAQPRTVRPGGLDVVRRGRGPTVVAIGPMLDRTLAALDALELDATVLYATTVMPFDTETLRAEAGAELIVVEPYLEGTTAGLIGGVLSDSPRRILSIGVSRAELRRYGTPEEHDRAHGLDQDGIRRRVSLFLATEPPPPRGPWSAAASNGH
jgi:transketolase